MASKGKYRVRRFPLLFVSAAGKCGGGDHSQVAEEKDRYMRALSNPSRGEAEGA